MCKPPEKQTRSFTSPPPPQGSQALCCAEALLSRPCPISCHYALSPRGQQRALKDLAQFLQQNVLRESSALSFTQYTPPIVNKQTATKQPTPIPMPEHCRLRALSCFTLLVGPRRGLPKPLHCSIAAPAAPSAGSSALCRRPRSSAQPQRRLSRSLHKLGTHSGERAHLLGDRDGTPSETVKAEPLSDCSPHPAGAVKWSCPEMARPKQEVPGGKMEIVLPWTANSSS